MPYKKVVFPFHEKNLNYFPNYRFFDYDYILENKHENFCIQLDVLNQIRKMYVKSTGKCYMVKK